ncbi:MAG: response regulator [Deltaproteobacteria bacterium]|nr:response regulator [Deltaproteobacteria bacterium]
MAGPAAAAEKLVFLVDDEDRNLLLFEKALSTQNYRLNTFHDGQEVLDALEQGEMPDLVVLDVMMPRVDGFTLCSVMKADVKTQAVPVILVTGLEDMRDKVRGLESGADDFLTKPFHPTELRARVRSLMRIKTLHDQLEDSNKLLRNDKLHLEALVQERTEELEGLTFGIVAALEMANELRDSDTGLHIRRVCSYSHALAKQMGMDALFAGKIRRYASLHDVGKVGIPDSILKKEGMLSDAEFEQMKLHTMFGYELLGIARADDMARNIALYHHERFDGEGYPRKLEGKNIPIEARIVSLADVYDALTTRRCYKDAFSAEEAERTIRAEGGQHFDPDIVDGMFAAIEEFHSIRSRYRDRS